MKRELRKLSRRFSRRLVVVLVAMFLLAVIPLVVFLTASAPSNTGSGSSTGSSSTGSSTLGLSTASVTTSGLAASYVSEATPHSSQWLVVRSQGQPSIVFANDTGIVPRYQDLGSLNATKIGTFCDVVNLDGTCKAFAYYQETGWFFDPAHQLLYIHYVGDNFVKISLFNYPPGAVFTTTVVTTTNSSSRSTTETKTVSTTVSAG